jgi:thiol-disulfide isomerase/thioredoxin
VFRARISIIAVIVAGLTILSFPGCKKSPKRIVAAEGLSAPDFSLRDINGNIWRLSDLKGSVVLVNFWASWCVSCKTEMPSLQGLYERKKDNPLFKLVTVLYRDDPMVASEYLEQNGYNFPLLIDTDGNASMDYGLTGVPETFIVDKTGILRKKIIGPADFESPEAIAYLKGIINE